MAQMLKADALISDNIRAVLPSSYKNAPYHKIKVGDTITIKEVVYSTYNVFEKDANGKVVYDDDGMAKLKVNGKNDPILNTTAYLLLDDGTMTSVKFRTAVSQLYSITGEPDKAVGTYHYANDSDDQPIECKVKVIPHKDRYGQVERDTFAFDPQ